MVYGGGAASGANAASVSRNSCNCALHSQPADADPRDALTLAQPAHGLTQGTVEAVAACGQFSAL